MAVALLRNVLQNLAELHTDGTSSVPQYLSTHGGSPSRRRTMLSLMSSLCVIWMRVWNSLLWCWMRISQVSPYPP